MNSQQRTRRLRMLLVSSVAAVALVLTGCTTGGGGGGETNVPDPVDSVNIGWGQDVSTLDQAKGTAQGDFVILENVYDSFMRRDANGDLVPMLVTDYEVSDDGLETTLHLREGVKFQNGEEMTAKDVVYSIKRWIDPAFPGLTYQGFHDHIADAEAVDDYTVLVTNKEPSPTWILDSPTRTPIIPADLGEELGYDGFGATPETAVGTGPYSIKEWVRDDHITLEAFPDYWGGKPPIDEVVIKIIPDGVARTAALLAGDVDMIQGVSVNQIAAIEANSELKVSAVDGSARTIIDLNANGGGPLADPLVREAVAHAIDVQSIIDNVLDGYGTELATFVQPVEQGFNADLKPYEFDPDLSKELLTEAGFPDGITGLELYTRTREPKGDEMIQAMQQMLADAGIQVDVQVLLDADYQKAMQQKSFDIGVFAHRNGGSFHPDFGLREVFGCDLGSAAFGSFFCDPEVKDLLIEASGAGKANVADADSIYEEIQQRLYDDYAIGGAWSQPFLYGMKKTLDWAAPASGGNWMGEASWSQ